MGWTATTLVPDGAGYPGGAYPWRGPAVTAGGQGTLWVAATMVTAGGRTAAVLLGYTSSGVPDRTVGDGGRIVTATAPEDGGGMTYFARDPDAGEPGSGISTGLGLWCL